MVEGVNLFTEWTAQHTAAQEGQTTCPQKTLYDFWTRIGAGWKYCITRRDCQPSSHRELHLDHTGNCK